MPSFSMEALKFFCIFLSRSIISNSSNVETFLFTSKEKEVLSPPEMAMSISLFCKKCLLSENRKGLIFVYYIFCNVNKLVYNDTF